MAEDMPGFDEIMGNADFDIGFQKDASRHSIPGQPIGTPVEVPVDIRGREIRLASNAELIESANKSLMRMSAIGGTVLVALAIRHGLDQGFVSEAVSNLRTSLSHALPKFHTQR